MRREYADNLHATLQLLHDATRAQLHVGSTSTSTSPGRLHLERNSPFTPSVLIEIIDDVLALISDNAPHDINDDEMNDPLLRIDLQGQR